MLRIKLLNQMRENYEHCSTYEDRGSVSVFSLPKTNQSQSSLSFRTNFRRGLFFNFEWEIPEVGLFKIWNDKDSATYLKIPSGKTSNFSSSRLALRVAAGISQGSSMLAPYLLHPSQKHDDLLGLKEAKLITKELLEGELTNIFEGTFIDEDDTTVWITDKLLLKKMSRANKISVDEQEKLFSDAARVIPEIAAVVPIKEIGTVVEYEYSQINLI